MNRDNFFKMFLFYLSQLPQEEAFKAATFFSDLIDDKIEGGISADAALRSLGDPRELAIFVLKEGYGIVPQLGRYVETQQPQAPAAVEIKSASGRQKDYMSDCTDIKQVNINVRNAAINAVVSADDKIHIKYEENEMAKFAASASGGVIDLVMTSGGNSGNSIMGIFSSKKKEPIAAIVLEVPAKYKENIMLTTENAAIQVTGIANANMLECGTTNSSLRIIDTTAGTVHAKTTNRRLTITNVNVEKDVSVSTTNASIDINKTNGESVSCKTTNSEISLNDVEAKNMIQATTTNAYIAITKIAGNYIDLRTTGGKISGTIMGNINDYSITSKSAGGKSNLPNIPFGVKRLSAITTKDNINITFQDPVQ